MMYYLSVQGKTVAVVTPLKPIRNDYFPRQVRELRSNIIAVEKDSMLCVVPLSSFLFKCIYISSCEVEYVAKPPYVCIYMYDD